MHERIVLFPLWLFYKSPLSDLCTNIFPQQNFITREIFPDVVLTSLLSCSVALSLVFPQVKNKPKQLRKIICFVPPLLAFQGQHGAVFAFVLPAWPISKCMADPLQIQKWIPCANICISQTSYPTLDVPWKNQELDLRKPGAKKVN